MPKFFVNKNQLNNNTITITGNDINHIKNVLRYEINDEIQITVIDEEQLLSITYLCNILLLNNDKVLCKINHVIEQNKETNTYIHLFQALPKLDKMEYIIQKNTEIGVKEFTPVITKRCIAKLDEKSCSSKIIRWQKICEVASKQSGRDIIPKINNIINLKNIYPLLKSYDIVIIAYENEQENTLKKELYKLKNKKQNKIAILIGPEGGFDYDEITKLKNIGAKTVTLGKTILRAETASIVICSNILFELED